MHLKWTLQSKLDKRHKRTAFQDNHIHPKWKIWLKEGEPLSIYKGSGPSAGHPILGKASQGTWPRLLVSNTSNSFKNSRVKHARFLAAKIIQLPVMYKRCSSKTIELKVISTRTKYASHGREVKSVCRLMIWHYPNSFMLGMVQG